MKKQILVIIFCIINSFSCQQKEKTLMPQNSSETLSSDPALLSSVFLRNPRLQDNVRVDFAQLLSKSLVDRGLRDYIKNTSLKKISGDYDFPYLLVYDDVIRDNETFESILMKYTDESWKNKYGNKTLSELVLEVDPYLSILVPVLSFTTPETWDTELVPNVVAHTNEIMENGYLGFDSKGEKILFKKQVEPKKLTLVIKHSENLLAVDLSGEHTIYNSKIKDALGFRNENPELTLKIKSAISQKKNLVKKANKEIFNFIKLNDLLSNSDSKIKFNNLKIKSTNTLTCRDKYPDQKDYVYDYTVSQGGWDIAHDWFEGSQIEMCLYIYLATYPNNNASFSSLLKRDAGRSHSDFMAGTISLDWEVLDWDKPTYGQIMKYKWFDSDDSEWSGSISGNAVYKNDSLGITAGVTGTVNYSSKNDDMGESFVEYCDEPYPWSYNFYFTGLVYFRTSIHY
jgi:hypothetical protein